LSRSVAASTRTEEFGRLAELLGGATTPTSLERTFNDPRQSPLQPALLAVNPPESARVTVLEHREDYPGLGVTQRTVREYPYGELAAQLLGYVGEVNSDDLKKYKGYEPGDDIGRAGVEAAYENVLRGVPERDTYEIAPTGYPVGDPIKVQPGSVGDDVQLSLNLDVQRVAEQELADGINQVRQFQDPSIKSHFQKFAAPAGAVVVLDAQTGGVVAMASNPSYNPSSFIGGISQDVWNFLNSAYSSFPLTNRATQGLYATGSTFKLVSAVAANQYGVYPWGQWYDDKGSIVIGGDKKSFQNAGRAVLGPVDLSLALTKSSDVYFYNVGNLFWQRWFAGDKTGGNGIQNVAREFGFGAQTGIELNEGQGRVPDATWKQQFAKILYKGNPSLQQENSQWFPGDNVHFAVGQGDFIATPLQLADAYAAFLNNGTLVTPHVAADVLSPAGKVVQQIAPKPRGHVSIDPATYNAMMAGFTGAVRDQKGTAYNAFFGFPAQFQIAGKTGTAQVDGKSDTSLFAGMINVGSKQYVVVTVVEQAGFGSNVAAPISRHVMEQLAGLPVSPLVIPKPTNTQD
jgi:penicillin-binding protein 2